MYLPIALFYEANIGNPVVWSTNEYPQLPIRITSQWAEYLDPFLPALNTTVLQIFFALIDELSEFNQKQFAEYFLSLHMANALARFGFNTIFEGNPAIVQVNDSTVQGSNYTDIDGTAWISAKEDFFYLNPEDKDKNWARFQVKSTIKGYAYNTNGFAPKIAISFLLSYCAIAFTHVFYSGITGISSTAWDSIAEVTALAMNSTPTAALRNTCAGITEMHIFRTPVRILVFKDIEGEGEHLEMVFGGKQEGENKTIKANRTYGTLPRMLRDRAWREKEW